MIASPPIANLLVIRSKDIDRAVIFYQCLGMVFHLHSHGKGPEHYASDIGGFVFEIYPQKSADEITTHIRFGFNVNNVDGVIDLLRQIHAKIVTEPTDTEWGRRAVVKDFDGHTVELVTSQYSESKIAKDCSGDTGASNAEEAK